MNTLILHHLEQAAKLLIAGAPETADELAEMTQASGDGHTPVKFLVSSMLTAAREALDEIAEDIEEDEMDEPIKEHDVVALLKAIPAEMLDAGDRGTVVHLHPNGRTCEVEFERGKVVTLPLDVIERECDE